MKKIFLLFTALLLFSCNTGKDSVSAEKTLTPLQPDPAIKTGVLDNGLHYYILENREPEKRLELRLAVNAGSMQEEDDQKGLAHFVEHMAFNGTKNFQKDELVKYLESLGMAFGPEINAYTSFDETVYMLSLPAGEEEVLNKGFQILEDWSRFLLLEEEEIDKERGVIVEEWRSGRGADGRYMDRLIEVFLKDSLYADRLPIGDMDIVKGAPYERFTDFYNTWYRPDLMAVIVVGDFNTEDIEKKIIEHFSYAGKENPVERTGQELPIRDETVVEVFQDPEITTSEISLYTKEEGRIIDTEESYREYIVDLMSFLMLNDRLQELAFEPDTPFLQASSGQGGVVRGLSVRSFSAACKEGLVSESLLTLMTEVERARRTGFTDPELERTKKLISMVYDNAYKERDNRPSSTLASEIIDYYLEGNVPAGVEKEYEMISEMLPGITLEEVNDNTHELFTLNNKNIFVRAPENSPVPTEGEILSVLETVEKQEYTGYMEESIERPLFDYELKPGAVAEESVDDKSGVITLKLTNGVRVHLKTTDFKEDEILFTGISQGGLSLVEDGEFLSGKLATSVLDESGINGFNSIELNKLLTGKNVSLSPWIGNYAEGLNGSSSRGDIETFFQLLWLYFMKPEFNEESYIKVMDRVHESIKNRNNSPKTLFNDTVRALLAGNHFRAQPMTAEGLKDVSLEEVKNIYGERFQDPSDFDFIFTGSFQAEEILPYILTYLGSLPAEGLEEEARDVGIKYPATIIKERLPKEIEEKSTVQVIFSGSWQGAEKDDELFSLVNNYLKEVLRVRVREEMSGTYGVGVFSDVRHFPVKRYLAGVYFGCEPGREEELINAIFEEIEKMKAGIFDQEIINAVVETYKKSEELGLKDNSYWQDFLSDAALHRDEFDDILESSEMLSLVSSETFRELTTLYFNENSYVQVILEPAE